MIIAVVIGIIIIYMATVMFITKSEEKLDDIMSGRAKIYKEMQERKEREKRKERKKHDEQETI